MRFQLAHIFCFLGAAEALAIGDVEKRYSSPEEYVFAFPLSYHPRPNLLIWNS
jgi:hypothetical protein